MHPIATVLYLVLTVYWFILIARLIIGYIVDFGGYRPHGAAAVAFEFVYSLTEPVLRPLDRLIPPLRIGSVALSLSFLIVILVLRIILIPLAASLPF